MFNVQPNFSYDEVATTNSKPNNYCTRSPVKTEPVPDLLILKHLSPGSSMYRQIIETFTSDKTKSPTLESLSRPQPVFFHQPSAPSSPSQNFYSPEVELISLEPPSPPVEVVEFEQEVQETYSASSPYLSEYNALNLFADAEHESEENCPVEINLDQKRKKASPLAAAVGSKKLRMSGEWQLNENELGQEFFVNQRTGQVAANVPIMTDGFLMSERRKYMPYGTSPIMQLAPSCELKMNVDVQQKLNLAVEENLNYAEEVGLAVKWQTLEELTSERDKLGNFFCIAFL